MGWQR
jgi:hypothetical protein